MQQVAIRAEPTSPIEMLRVVRVMDQPLIEWATM